MLKINIMKNTRIFLFLLASIFCFVSCDKDEEITSQSFSLELSYPSGFTSHFASGFKIEVVNTLTQNKKNYVSDEKGIVSLTGFSDGVYNIQGSAELTAAEAFLLVGTKQPLNLTFSLLEFAVNSDIKDIVKVILTSSQKSSLVISEIYASPSVMNSLTSMYIELYNNSDDPISLDGKYIAVMGGPASKDFGTPFEIGKGKLFFESLIQIPGSGNDYVIAGKSFFLISANAKSFDYMAEGSYDMVLSVDLSQSDLEVNSIAYNNKIGLDAGTLAGVMYFDTDNPSVDNAILKYLNTANWWFFNPGYCASILLFDTDNDIEKEVYTEGTNTAFVLYQKDIQVIDGVDYLINSQSADYKTLTSNYDSGFTFLSGEDNMYKRKSMNRKRSTDSEGRLIFVDTNNSSNDFEELDPSPAK